MDAPPLQKVAAFLGTGLRGAPHLCAGSSCGITHLRMLGEHCMTGDVPSQLFSNSLALAQSTRPALRDRASARTSEHCVCVHGAVASGVAIVVGKNEQNSKRISTHTRSRGSSYPPGHHGDRAMLDAVGHYSPPALRELQPGRACGAHPLTLTAAWRREAAAQHLSEHERFAHPHQAPSARARRPRSCIQHLLSVAE